MRRPAPPLRPGLRGEDYAAAYLTQQGCRILERNVRLGRYELDIIAQEGDTIVFVEVRSRSVRDGFLPEDSVGPRKQLHLRRAAQHYLSRHQDRHTYYRFDVVAVILGENDAPEITLYRDAFR
ncbi:MAG: YraN family protein [Candidatus Hydrogenedentes bacterium]|nr:YraN family protein [Candidatus Hydrogenedentota bacterium]